MKNRWLIWLFVLGTVIAVFIAFNYQGNQGTVPISELLPEDETVPMDIEYEFVDEKGQPQPVAGAPEEIQGTASVTVKGSSTDVLSATPGGSVSGPAQMIATPQEPSMSSVGAVSSVNETVGTYAYTIQVLSVNERARADKALEDVRKKGYEPFIVSKDLGAKGTWYRINVGKFDTKPQAEEVLSQIKKDYAGSFIISPKK
ncbi:MAG: hypothetical protein A2Z81_03660 [Omnitrophica WOR_2 bacterium GWA2_45_18]|nr:MAG: hypothetical protein A2Z81_03660 [Omnitrophica WOR_2 bacterium GWA2_45_18]